MPFNHVDLIAKKQPLQALTLRLYTKKWKTLPTPYQNRAGMITDLY